MQDWSSRGINQSFQEVSPFRQFISKFEEILVVIVGDIILISAFWQSLFRDELLAWLRNILESN